MSEEIFENTNNCDCNAWMICIALILSALFLFRMWMQGESYRKRTLIRGKVVIVTGSNTGIGKETALDLASRGAKVYMACRDKNRCEAARQEIIEKTGNKNVINIHLDLSSLDSIRAFAKNFLQLEKRLDILINNAGLLTVERTETKDGFETTIGVNHLGPFLLTNLLLDVLKQSKPSRIVNVSSMGHAWGKIQRDDLQSKKSFNKWTTYGNSKLANILFTRELAKRLEGTGVTANSLHPGCINTDIGRNQPTYMQIFAPIAGLFLKTSKAGAQTTIAVALDPDLREVTGKYFAECEIKKESKAAQDDDTAKWLWNKSAELTGLKKNN